MSKTNEPTSAEWGTAIEIGVDLHRVTDDAVKALATDSSVFTRGGALVHVVRDARPPADVARALGTPTLRVIQIATLREKLAQAAVWQKYDKRTEKHRVVTPPEAIVAAVAARGEWPGVRPIVGILETPALRPDGSIIDVEGYDAATGYVYLPNASYPQIDDAPTLADAVAARDELLDVVGDFPFATDAGRAAWIAFLLTLFARPAIDGCVPLAAVDATTRGTGKGKLVDAAATIATGREATKTPLAEHDAEMRKRITSLVIEGEALACIDNVSAPINFPSLDAAVTATRWKDRVLGRSATASAPNNIVWAVTGNNLDFGGDLVRRVLHIRLESPLERPEDRSDFRRRDLLAWTRAERPRLVRAALTILRGFYAAGCPEQGVRPWGSFEAWSRIIANCVRWTGMADPTQTRTDLESTADTAKSALVALLDGWRRVAPSGATAKEAIRLLYPTRRYGDAEAPPDGLDELREAVESLAPPPPGKSPTPRALGLALRRLRRRVVGSRMLDGESAHGGAVRWRVVEAKPGGYGENGGLVTNLRAQTVDVSIESAVSKPTVATIPTGGAVDLADAPVVELVDYDFAAGAQ